VRLPDFVRTTTFRWTAGTFVVCIFLFSGFVYWQTAAYMTTRIDDAITEEAVAIAAEPPERRLEVIEDRLGLDPRRIKLAGLFDAGRTRIVGNLATWPAGLEADLPARNAVVVRADPGGNERQSIRVVARRLANGDLLVIGRNVDEFKDMAEIVGRSLALGLLPAACLALAAGMLLSVRAERRVRELRELVGHIVAGDLRQRLPTQGLDHPFDKLAGIANGMLDEIEALIHAIAGVGDDIAHDLRTPLTRVRASLERGRDNARTLEELQAVTDRAITGLDQSLAIITALLRIAEIEHGRRLAGFGEVELAGIVHEVAELYAPIAEDKNVHLRVAAAPAAPVRGDRDLLFEAITNLVDNAVKFTPEGGHVDLTLLQRAGQSVIRIADTGPGISEAEREAVTRRFYRSDKSRNTQGVGLGLSLVAAITSLHGFQLTIGGGPGCTVEITCPRPHAERGRNGM
jgi:signal transduction histidine kinase